MEVPASHRRRRGDERGSLTHGDDVIAEHPTRPLARSVHGSDESVRLESEQSSRRPPSPRLFWPVLIALWVLCAGYLAPRLSRGWVPHDEGTIGVSAERVMAGELPHRDFDDTYTGGLNYINAAAFSLFGKNLVAPRILLLAAFLLMLPAFYYAATRFVSPLPAAGMTLLAVVWSLPNYIAALPSWYNLIFAVLGTAAMLRYLESERTRWLVVAGVCGGLSFLIKLVGIYYVAAVLLALAYREQQSARAAEPGGSGTRRWVYPVAVAGGLVLFVLALVALIWPSRSLLAVFHFVVPSAAVAIIIGDGELRLAGHGRPASQRFAALARLCVPFLAGVLLPVIVFLIPYLISDSLGDLVRGVFITPSRRLASASWPLAPGSMLGLAALLAALGLSLVRMPPQGRWICAGALAAGLAVILELTGWVPRYYRTVWGAVRPLIPVIVLGGALLLTKSLAGLPALRRERLVLVLAVTALCSLIQYPFGVAIYFCYVIPLLALAVTAVVSELSPRSRLVSAALVLFLIGFGVLRLNPGFIYGLGYQSHVDPQTERLALARAGILVTAGDKAMYERLVTTLRQRAGGDYIYVAPDAPEVYFLSGLRNPTRTLYDFFDEPEGRTERVLRALEEHDVRVVALNRGPQFSEPVSGALREALERRYPAADTIWRFEVRWR